MHQRAKFVYRKMALKLKNKTYSVIVLEVFQIFISRKIQNLLNMNKSLKMLLLKEILFCLPIKTIYLPAGVDETNCIPIVRKDNNNVFILF